VALIAVVNSHVTFKIRTDDGQVYTALGRRATAIGGVRFGEHVARNASPDAL
jgi:hypothetical protein